VGKFGDKFRKERERRDIKLEDVSNSTKIGSRMLRAIEEERFDQLPGGVFNKGFIRAYAKYLGLDEEETITGYVAALNQFNSQQWDAEKPAPQPSATERSPAQPRSGPSGSSQGSSGQSNSGQSDSGQSGSGQPGPGKFISSEPPERQHIGEQRNDPRQRSTDSRPSDPQDIELPDLQLPKAEHVRPRRRMAVHSDLDGSRWRLPALVVLLIVAGAFWWSHSRNARANSASPASANLAPARPAPVSSGPASLSPSSAKTALISPASASAGSNDGAKTAATSSHISSPVTPSGKAGAHPGSPSASAQASANASAANTSVAKEAAQAEADPSTAPPAPKPVANLTLVIRASETSWIAVTADGQPVVHETLIAPAHTSVRASREIVVRAGNAAGITFALNGQEFPSQGAEGEVKTLIFDSTGLRLGATPATSPTPPVPTTPAADPTH
jgi:cytoskeletal protein RodZ